jgi:nucleoside-diphosphate-sugar epimerase
MRIFVTGGSGFIGSHFVDLARARGHEVTALCRTPTGGKAAAVTRLETSGAVVRRGSILVPREVESALREADCVCHFAAAFRESGVPDQYFSDVNVAGMRIVLERAAQVGVPRFVLCSTAGIHGQRVSGVLDEGSPVRPWNAYEQSKVDAEALLLRRASDLGIDPVIIRPASVYGPRDDRLLKMFKLAAVGRFPLFGAGLGRRHMIYVSDLAEAFLKACEVPQAASEAFIAAGPEAVPLREMLATLAAELGRPSCGPRLPAAPMIVLSAVTEDVCRLLRVDPPLYRRRMDFYRNDAEFNCAKARRILGWQPGVDLAEGLRRTLEDYRASGLLG